MEVATKFGKCLALLAVACGVGCATPGGGTADEQRASIRSMRDRTMRQMESMKPGVTDEMRKAAGYGVFTTVGGQFLLVGGGSGYGVVRDNRTGRDFYMRMAEVDLGPGLGLKEFRAVFVFHNADTLHTFIDRGWEFGAAATASALNAGTGGAASAGISARPMDIYRLTDRGYTLEATVNGTKYWPDDALNYSAEVGRP